MINPVEVVAALVGDQLYPLDPVDFFHGVVDAADIDSDDAFGDGNFGLVLLAAGLNSVGDKLIHGKAQHIGSPVHAAKIPVDSLYALIIG